MSVDPELSQTIQPYAYAADDPVNQSDPTGMHTNPIACVLSLFACVVTGGHPPSWVNPFEYIQSVQWTVAEEDPPNPCPVGWRLLVTPTSWGRFSYPGIEPLAWHEVLHLAGPRADTSTMHDQFDCHWFGVRLKAPRKPTWDLETWRPDIGVVGFLENSCN
jgi:hypothetical protein